MIKISNLTLSINESKNQRSEILKKLKITEKDIDYFEISKKSLDARKKENIVYIYTLYFSLKDKNKTNTFIRNCKKYQVTEETPVQYKFPKPVFSSKPVVVIVGFGPAGIFTAYKLALAGIRPIVLERGEAIPERTKTVDIYMTTDKLNAESNIQFGEGGAGTYSDGKLNTQVKDTTGRIHDVLNTFVSFGAPEEIKYDAKPHIGTDKLKNVVINMRKKIIELGGEVIFGAKLIDFNVKDNAIHEVIYIKENDKHHILCDDLVIAIGHSARDTFKMIYEKKLIMEPKPMAIGLRIEHPNELISRSQYGDSYKLLPSADYKVTHTCKDGRGVYSFCMCPGGHIVNASSIEGQIAVNGMSYYARDAKYSNSALIVTVTEADYRSAISDNSPLCGMYFQNEWEKNAFEEGKGHIPVQTYKDFRENKTADRDILYDTDIIGSTSAGNLNNCLPKVVSEDIKEGITAFEHKIHGFSSDDAILAGIEARTSSPVRIVRNEDFMSNIRNIYPAGEGAGYAGGIMSAAVDGIKIAEAIVNKYNKKAESNE